MSGRGRAWSINLDEYSVRYLGLTYTCHGFGGAGSYLRLIDSCITQLKAQGPSRTCNESKEEEEKGFGCVGEGNVVEGLGFCGKGTSVFPDFGERGHRCCGMQGRGDSGGSGCRGKVT